MPGCCKVYLNGATQLRQASLQLLEAVDKAAYAQRSVKLVKLGCHGRYRAPNVTHLLKLLGQEVSSKLSPQHLLALAFKQPLLTCLMLSMMTLMKGM